MKSTRFVSMGHRALQDNLGPKGEILEICCTVLLTLVSPDLFQKDHWYGRTKNFKIMLGFSFHNWLFQSANWGWDFVQFYRQVWAKSQLLISCMKPISFVMHNVDFIITLTWFKNQVGPNGWKITNFFFAKREILAICTMFSRGFHHKVLFFFFFF